MSKNTTKRIPLNDKQKLQLFAESGGYCQNPTCNELLFKGTIDIHIGELAHIFAAEDNGPRSNKQLSAQDRNSVANIILLCPTCHTIIDKAEDKFPAHLCLQWKNEHIKKITEIFSTKTYPDRNTARQNIELLLLENKIIFDELNPSLSYNNYAEHELAEKWKASIKQTIIPNNQKIIEILRKNNNLLTLDEKKLLIQLEHHNQDLISRHILDIVIGDQRRFPEHLDKILL
jgi:hypothetical protein